MKPDTIIIHCSATRENSDVTIEQIDQMHKARNFKRPNQSEALKHIGYHYYIRKDGTVNTGRHEDELGAQCKGWNDRSIGICYEGGLDAHGNAKDTRTPEQKKCMIDLVNDVCSRWDILQVIGHRDTSPDLNGNGTIEASERLKECPCFDVKPEFSSFINLITVRP
ncbi:MAG: N-acetylmuramoyl-L-alanine amidase [Mangrovibacterium sp.]